ISKAPAVQSLVRRVEDGGALSVPGICGSAQPFFAALLRNLFPRRPIVVVTDNLKTQESFHQNLETWLSFEPKTKNQKPKVGEASSAPASPRFYPPWEVLPHDGKLPHADTISDRLQTLVALSAKSETGPGGVKSEMIVTSVSALLQKTFPPALLRERTRMFSRGDRIDPLDLIEGLEAQGYEPEAQVSQKGEMALRGGILDVWPLTS